MLGNLVSVDVIAERFDASREWVYSAARKEVIPSVRVGGLLRFDIEEIDKYIAEHSTKAVA